MKNKKILIFVLTSYYIQLLPIFAGQRQHGTLLEQPPSNHQHWHCLPQGRRQWHCHHHRAFGRHQRRGFQLKTNDSSMLELCPTRILLLEHSRRRRLSLPWKKLSKRCQSHLWRKSLFHNHRSFRKRYHHCRILVVHSSPRCHGSSWRKCYFGTFRGRLERGRYFSSSTNLFPIIPQSSCFWRHYWKMFTVSKYESIRA